MPTVPKIEEEKLPVDVVPPVDVAPQINEEIEQPLFDDASALDTSIPVAPRDERGKVVETKEIRLDQLAGYEDIRDPRERKEIRLDEFLGYDARPQNPDSFTSILREFEKENFPVGIVSGTIEAAKATIRKAPMRAAQVLMPQFFGRQTIDNIAEFIDRREDPDYWLENPDLYLDMKFLTTAGEMLRRGGEMIKAPISAGVREGITSGPIEAQDHQGLLLDIAEKIPKTPLPGLGPVTAQDVALAFVQIGNIQLSPMVTAMKDAFFGKTETPYLDIMFEAFEESTDFSRDDLLVTIGGLPEPLQSMAFGSLALFHGVGEIGSDTWVVAMGVNSALKAVQARKIVQEAFAASLPKARAGRLAGTIEPVDLREGLTKLTPDQMRKMTDDAFTKLVELSLKDYIRGPGRRSFKEMVGKRTNEMVSKFLLRPLQGQAGAIRIGGKVQIKSGQTGHVVAIQKDIAKVEITPGNIVRVSMRELQEIPEAPTAVPGEGKGVFEFQSASGEQSLQTSINPNIQDVAGLTFRIENSGDILRELALNQDKPDLGYINSKIKSIETLLDDPQREMREEFSSEDRVLSEEYLAALGRIKQAYVDQPTETSGQEAALKLTNQIIDRDFAGAKKTLEKIKDLLKSGEFSSIKALEADPNLLPSAEIPDIPTSDGVVTIQDIEKVAPAPIKKASRESRKLVASIIQAGGVNEASMINKGFTKVKRKVKRRNKKTGKVSTYEIEVWPFPPGFVTKGGGNFDTHAVDMFEENLIPTNETEELVAMIKAGESTLAQKQILNELGMEKRIKDEEKRLALEAKAQTAEERGIARILEIQKEAFNMGMEAALKKSPGSDIRVLDHRILRAKAAQEQFGLSDADMKSIADRDFRLMSDYEFENFMDDIQSKALQLRETLDAKAQLMAQIDEKHLINWQNLVKVLDMPNVEEMTFDQLRQFELALEPYKNGDIFLPIRTLSVVDKTDLKGVKTLREAREKLAEQMQREFGVDVGKIEGIKIDNTLNRMMANSILSEQNAFFNLVVNLVERAFLISEANILQIEPEIFRLADAARESVPKSLKDILAPTDDLAFQYIAFADDSALAKMTAEQMDYTFHLKNIFQNALEFLIAEEILAVGRAKYMVFIRRTLLEGVLKGDSVTAAFKDILNQQKEDITQFEIRDTKDGKILTLSQFFRFSMQRTGKITPTKNLARASVAYFKALEKKKAFDRILGQLDTYIVAMGTEEDVIAGKDDTKLRRFLDDFINTKKGITKTIFFEQYSKIDLIFRAVRTSRAFRDLFASVALLFSQPLGEQSMSIANIGLNSFILGWGRLLNDTKKSVRIINKYRNFTGKDFLEELKEPTRDAFQKLSFIGLQGMFQLGSVHANKIELLGSMTPEEWASEEVSISRLAQIRINSGRNRKLPGQESVFGAPTEGRFITTYRTWAVPPLTSTIRELRITIESLSKGEEIPKVTKDRLLEKTKSLVILGSIVALGSQFVDKDDDSLIGKTIRKMAREMMTLASVFNPLTFGAVSADFTYIFEFSKAAWQLIALQKYKDKTKGLKGIPAMVRFLSPVAITQFTGPLGVAPSFTRSTVQRAGEFLGSKKSNRRKRKGSSKRKF